MVDGVMAKDLSQRDVDRILRSGEGIAAMRASLDDMEFGEDRLLDPEQQEEWRGHLTGEQMRRWVRRSWYGGERGFIGDDALDGPELEGAGDSMASASKLRKAEEKGKAAALKKKPRAVNPYEDSDPQHDMFDQGWRQQSQSGKAAAV